MAIIITALFVVGAILAGVELVQSQFRSLLSWAVLLIAIALLLGRLA